MEPQIPFGNDKQRFYKFVLDVGRGGVGRVGGM